MGGNGLYLIIRCPAPLCALRGLFCGLQWAHISVSARGRCGTGMLVPSEERSRAISSVVPSATSGHQTGFSSYTRDQSRKTGSLCRIFGCVENSAKHISMGAADHRKGLQNSFWFSSTQVQWDPTHSGRSRAGSGDGIRGKSSVGEGGYKTCSSSWQKVWVIQPVFYHSKKGWGVVSDSRSAPTRHVLIYGNAIYHDNESAQYCYRGHFKILWIIIYYELF